MTTPDPDFLRPVRGPHRLAWLALTAALAVLGVAAAEAWQAHDERARAQAAAQRLARPAPPPPAAAEPAPQRALRQALARAERPWGEVFASVEAVPASRIAWLSLDVGEGGTLRLEGETTDAATALAAAQALRASPLWRDVVVGRLDRAPRGGQRFALVATPAEGAW